jgi:hypothetical protein
MDGEPPVEHHGLVIVSPLPQHGDVVVGRDLAGRTLRISSHPELGRVVLSIWQDSVCRATFRLAPEDVPAFVEVLARSVLRAGPADQTGELHTAG